MKSRRERHLQDLRAPETNGSFARKLIENERKKEKGRWQLDTSSCAVSLLHTAHERSSTMQATDVVRSLMHRLPNVHESSPRGSPPISTSGVGARLERGINLHIVRTVAPKMNTML